MREVGSFEAKTKLPQLLREASQGEVFIITNHGKPIARLGPISESDKRSQEQVVEELLNFKTAKYCADIPLEDVTAAIRGGRR